MSLSTWKVKELEDYVGGLSKPSKMPGFGYSLPAQECKTGGKLQKVENSVCHGCYAMKGRYAFPNVKAAMYRRLEAIEKLLWADAMAELLNRRAAAHPHFRWHDSGDLQSVDHLTRIVQVCEQTPGVMHWLPTREYRIVRDYHAEHGVWPDNLNIRLSAHMIGGHVPLFKDLPATVSTVSKDNEAGGFDCPSRFQGNECGDCRACWNKEVPHVDYHLH